jgi:hypothetical protein
MKYTVEMISDGLMYILDSMTIDSGAQVVLMLLRRQFERL